MKKPDLVEYSQKKNLSGDKLPEISHDTRRLLDSIPAQIDAIKAEKEKAARELRQFVRQRESNKDNKG